jgi:hypothetical protein
MRNPADADGGALETVHAAKLNSSRDTSICASSQRLSGYTIGADLLVATCHYQSGPEAIGAIAHRITQRLAGEVAP